MWVRSALCNAVRILDGRILAALRRHVRREHSLRTAVPRSAAVVADPHAAARNSQRDVVVVGRVDADRVDPRVVVAAAEPMFALGLAPQRLVQRPGCAAVLGAKQSARQRPGPQLAGPLQTSRFQRPDQLHGWSLRAGFLLRIRRGAGFLPGTPLVFRAMQLHAEVPEVQRRVQHSVGRIVQDHRDRVAEKRRSRDRPARATFEREQALSRGDEEALAHGGSPVQRRVDGPARPSASRQRLRHEKLVRSLDGIAELVAVLDQVPVDEHGHVLPQAALVIEHVASQTGVVGKDTIENLPHRGSRRFDTWSVNMPLQVRCERNSWHGPPSTE